LKLLVLKGLSQNGVLTVMAERLAEAFAHLGAETRVLSVSHDTVVRETVTALGGGGFDTVLSFAGFGGDIATSEGLSLYDAANARFIAWAVDHPAFHLDRYVGPVARRYVVSATPSHFDFLGAAGARATKVALLSGAADLSSAAKPFAQRSHPLLLAASWLGAPQRWWEEGPGSPVAAIGAAVMSRLMDDPGADLFAAWRGAMAELGYELPIDQNTGRLLAELMLYARRLDRIRLVEALAARGLPVALCGDGWNEIEAVKHLERIESRDVTALERLYGDCRVVLNLNAGNGASERVMAAFSAGAAVASDANPLLGEALGDALLTYDRTDMGKAADAIGNLLESNDAEARAEAGAARVRGSHLWPHRAATLIASVKKAEELA
jgi:hypothetical protein